MFFIVFFLYLTSSLVLLFSEKTLDMISAFLNLLRLVMFPSMHSILENVPCALEKSVYSEVDAPVQMTP